MDEDKIASLQERVKSRVKNKVCQQQKARKSLPAEELKRPVISPSLESILSEPPTDAQVPSSKIGSGKVWQN